MPTTAKGNKPANTYTTFPKAATFDKVINDYTGSASITEDMKWFNKDYFDKGFSSTNSNMRAVAYLLDKAIWTDKFKGNGAEYIVGGPSLDMVLSSYNQFTNQSNVYQSRAESSNGYKISDNSGANWDYGSSARSKYLTKGDTLYRISSQSNAINYWVSSPSAYNTDCMMYVSYDGSVDCTRYNNLIKTAGNGFRPIVCLKSGVSLKEVEEGKSYQI